MTFTVTGGKKTVNSKGTAAIDCNKVTIDGNAAMGDFVNCERLFRVGLECVSKCRKMQFRVDLPAFQGDFPQA